MCWSTPAISILGCLFLFTMVFGPESKSSSTNMKHELRFQARNCWSTHVMLTNIANQEQIIYLRKSLTNDFSQTNNCLYFCVHNGFWPRIKNKKTQKSKHKMKMAPLKIQLSQLGKLT